MRAHRRTCYAACKDRVAAGEWRKDQQAADWVGKVIATEIDVDLSDKTGKARVSRMLRTWIDSGALRVVEHKDKIGKTRNSSRSANGRPDRVSRQECRTAVPAPLL